MLSFPGAWSRQSKAMWSLMMVHAIVISVEPYPDYDPAPYAIKPLMAFIYKDTTGMSLIPLNNISENVPSGRAQFH
ncbi:MAG: hypothetical protein R3B45_16940 [Bdellovibrionota bacterium]